jgi:uncharacterized protein (TIGR02266 family)
MSSLGSQQAPVQSDKIFIVDDSVTIRELVAQLVRLAGGTAATFESAEKCIEALKQERPTLILMDFHMDSMRGDKACIAIKDMCGPSLPVIIMTSEGALTEIMESVQAGADDFLPKPIRRPQLESKIAAVRAIGKDDPNKSLLNRQKQRLLYVERPSRARQLLGDVLENAGYQLLYANDITTARQHLERSADDLDAVLVDFDDGANDLLQLITDVLGEKKKPIVALSTIAYAPVILEQARKLSGGPVLDRRKHPVEAILSLVNARLHRLSLDMRAALRVPFYALIEFRNKGQTEWLSGFSHDLSSGGVFIRTLTPLKHGSDIEVRIAIPREKPLGCSGLVAWSNSPQVRQGFSCRIGMGVKFSLDPHVAERVAAMVRDHQTVGSSANGA